MRLFPSKILKVWSVLSLLFIVKWQENRWVEKEIGISKGEPGLEDLENSQPIQVVHCRNTAKDVAGRGFAKEIRHMTHGSNQPSQGEARNRDEVIKERRVEELHV